jgi:MFS transporter, PAT family, beta-lactamase induction signal transducer AmpG
MGLDQLRKFASSKRMWVVLLMGFSSGLPLLLTGGTLKTWLAREEIDITTIGFFTLVSMAYSLKFFWAPIVDRYRLFFFGRRRSWILCMQVLVAGGLFQLSTLDPKNSLTMMAIISAAIAFFSATQDIAIDAYRREILDDDEMGLGSTLTQYGYRGAMLLTGGVGVGLVGTGNLNFTWNQLYILMGVVMSLMTLVTIWAPEPEDTGHAPTSLASAIVDPFKDFFSRDKAFFILSFVFLFKLGDAMSASMLNPFYVQMGYTNAEIGLIAKTVGLVALLAGLLVGGLIIFKLGILKSLWVFGFLQALSTAGFSIITFVGPQEWALSLAVIFEDISSGMGSAAFIAYLSTITNKKFTGTQFALLSALATSGRNVFSAVAGVMVKSLGWAPFFWVCALLAIPGLIMLWFIQSHAAKEAARQPVN